MNNDTVTKVVNDWSHFLVQANTPLRKRLGGLFLTELPEAVLPHTIKTIEDAVSAYAEILDANRMTEQANNLRNSLMFLSQYTDNKSALANALNNIEFRNNVVARLQNEFTNSQKKDLEIRNKL